MKIKLGRLSLADRGLSFITILGVLGAVWLLTPSFIDPYTDLGVYLQVYRWAEGAELGEFLSRDIFETGYMFITWLAVNSGVSFFLFLFIIRGVFYTSVSVLFTAMFPSSSSLSALLAFLTIYYPLFTSMTANVIRQGIATSVIFLTLAYAMNEKFTTHSTMLRSVIFITGFSIAFLFHSSAVLVFVAYTVAKIISLRSLLGFWFIVAVFYTQNYFGGADIINSMLGPIARLNSSLSQSYSDYSLGFKWTFLAISLIPVVMYKLIRTIKLFPNNNLATIIKMYLSINVLGMLMANLPFHDRVFLYSWSLIPFIVLGGLYTIVTQVRFYWGRPELTRNIQIGDDR